MAEWPDSSLCLQLHWEAHVVKRRIAYSYAGMLIPGIVFLAFASAATMGGHSLLYLIVMVCPLGLLTGLVLSDIRRNVRATSIITRTLFAATISIVLILIMGGALEIFFGSAGYLLVPVVLPVLVASVSDLIGRREKATRDNRYVSNTKT